MTPAMSPLQSWAFLAVLVMLAIALVVIIRGLHQRISPPAYDDTDLNRVDRIDQELRRTEPLRRMGGRR